MSPAAAAAIAMFVAVPAFASDPFTYEITRHTHGGNAIRVVNILSVNPDCSPNKVSHRVVTPPKGGTLTVEPGEGYGAWSKPPRDKCSDKPIFGLIGVYTPGPGFVGEDFVELHGFDDGGHRQAYRITITVE